MCFRRHIQPERIEQMLNNTFPVRRSSRAKRRGANTAPTNFDPAAYPIISQHFFGVEPFRLIGEVAAEIEPEALEAVGGDGFWPAPLREV